VTLLSLPVDPLAGAATCPDSSHALPFHENTWPVLVFVEAVGDPGPVDAEEAKASVAEDEVFPLVEVC